MFKLRPTQICNCVQLVGSHVDDFFCNSTFPRIFRSAELLNHTKTPCSHRKTFVPDTKNKIYVFYIAMKHKRDYQTWNNVARCFKIWDLDARGFHKSAFRLWYKQNHLIVVGCPSSEYCSLKPDKVVPIDMPNEWKRPNDEMDGPSVVY